MVTASHAAPTASPNLATPGEIVPGALYRIDEAKARMGWRNSAFRAACRAGLKTYRNGRRTYVLGSDLVAFITRGGGQ
jgi:hypothetical protein